MPPRTEEEQQQALADYLKANPQNRKFGFWGSKPSAYAAYDPEYQAFARTWEAGRESDGGQGSAGNIEVELLGTAGKVVKKGFWAKILD